MSTSIITAGRGVARTSLADELRAAVSGGVVLPSDAAYAASVQVWNRAVTRRPAAVAACRSAEDVAAAVRIARRHAVPLSVRGGGHDWAGRAVVEGGVVVDLAGMRDVVIDPVAGVARVGGGARVRDVLAAAAPFGLVAVTGNCGTVGLAGLTLGGGYSLFGGTYGLAADNLVAAEVVLADGRRVTTDATREPELFWALRGGGGNFGVATSLTLRLFEAPEVLAGRIVFPIDEADDVLRRYGASLEETPDELGVLSVFMPGPDGAPTLALAPVWHGDRVRGEAVIEELRRLGRPLVADVGPTTFAELVAGFDSHWAEPPHAAMRTRWLPELSPGAVAAMTGAMRARTSPRSAIIMHRLHGAGTRIAPDATAFGMRAPHVLVEIGAIWDGTADGAADRRWADELWSELEPHALAGGYGNMLGPDDVEQAASAYGGNAARLITAKRRFDPAGVFASAIPLPSAVLS